MLTEKVWLKQDQIKKNNLDNSINKKYLYQNQILEFCNFDSIKLLDKTKVYDIEVQEYHNFILEKQIIHNSIEQDADLVLMLYKENNEQQENKKILDIIIAKHRNGPIGNFQLLFHTETCKFSNIKKHYFISTIDQELQ